MLARKSEQFTPLSQANTRRVCSLVELPLNLSDKVGINTNLTETLLQLGGFRNLRIFGDENGETSQALPQVVGMNADGAALAGKIAVKPAEIQQHTINDLGMRRRKPARWNDVDVTLNLAEMQHHIRETNESVCEPKSWVREINTALRQGLVNAGVTNLLGRLNAGDTVLGLFIYINDLLIESGIGWGNVLMDKLDPHPPSAVGLLQQFLLAGVVITAFDSYKYGHERPGEGRRVSMVIGPELDRALVLAVVGNLSMLAGVVESTE